MASEKDLKYCGADCDSQIEQLVVEDLKESPKNVYSRLNVLARLAQANKFKAMSQSQPLSVKDDSSQTQDLKKMSRRSSSSSGNSTTQNEYDDNTHDEESTANDEPRHVKTSVSFGQQPKKSNLFSAAFSSSNSQSNIGTKKHLPTTVATHHRRHAKKQRAKILQMSKKSNSISDIEVEDDLMFDVDDDNDSLSSTIGLSQHTLVFGGTTSNTMSTKSKHVLEKEESGTQLGSQPSSGDDCTSHGAATTSQQQINHEKFVKTSASLAKITSSMSDIDPDENILKNLLIKNQK